MGKRSTSSSTDFNMVSGVKNDFSLLLHRFVETNSVRYEHFAEIWRSMKMPLIFAGRQSDLEVREFTEECMAIAFTYVMPPNVFQEKIGGLFLLYGLFYKQLFEPKVKIRVTRAQWLQLQSLMVEVRSQNHYDIEYVYLKLQHDNAFHFVAHSAVQTVIRESTEDNPDRAGKAQEGQAELDRLQQRHSLISEMVEGDAIDQLSGIHDQYHRIKCTIAGPGAQVPQTSLNMIEPNIVQFITKKIAQFEWWKKYRAGKRVSRRRHDSGPTTSESEAESEGEKMPSSPRKSKNMGSVRAEIKARAMGSSADVSRSRRHRRVRHVAEVNESFQSTGSPSPKANVKKLQHDSSDDEYNTSKSLNESQETTSSEHAEGILSMPSLRYLEEPKRSKRKRKVGQEKKEKPKQRKRASRKKGVDPPLDSSHEDKETDEKNSSAVQGKSDEPSRGYTPYISVQEERTKGRGKGKGKGKGKSTRSRKTPSDVGTDDSVFNSSTEKKNVPKKRKAAELKNAPAEVAEDETGTPASKLRKRVKKGSKDTDVSIKTEAPVSLDSSVESNVKDLSLSSACIDDSLASIEPESDQISTQPAADKPKRGRGRPPKKRKITRNTLT